MNPRKTLLFVLCASVLALPAFAGNGNGNGQNPHDAGVTYAPPLTANTSSKTLTVLLDPGFRPVVGCVPIGSTGRPCPESVKSATVSNGGLAIMRLDREIFEACMRRPPGGCSGFGTTSDAEPRTIGSFVWGIAVPDEDGVTHILSVDDNGVNTLATASSDDDASLDAAFTAAGQFNTARLCGVLPRDADLGDLDAVRLP